MTSVGRCERTSFLLLSLSAFCCSADMLPESRMGKMSSMMHRTWSPHERVGADLGACDFVCMAGVVMLAAAFHQRTGSYPEWADLATGADLLSELTGDPLQTFDHLSRESLVRCPASTLSRRRLTSEEGLRKDLLADGLSAEATQALLNRLSQLRADAELYKNEPARLVCCVREDMEAKGDVRWRRSKTTGRMEEAKQQTGKFLMRWIGCCVNRA